MTDREHSRSGSGASHDAIIEDYLIRLASGEDVSSDEVVAGIDDPTEARRLLATLLAEEYLWRAGGGQSVRMHSFLDRLEVGDVRDIFFQLLDDNRLADQHLPSNLAPGHVVADRYEIVFELGRGGMGVVFAAVDRELDRRVALKVFNFQALSRAASDWEAMVLDESRALAGLKSRNIVTIYDAQRDDEHSYLVMDLVDGMNLSAVLDDIEGAEHTVKLDGRQRVELLRQSLDGTRDVDREDLIDPKSWFRTMGRIAQQIALTIEKAHEEGIVHRDLKPNNILLVDGGEPVILDFGLASRLKGDEPRDHAALSGTPSYIAPEQARDFKTGRDPRTDIYQIGVVLYEMLTLRQAFPCDDGEDLLELLGRIRSGAFDAPSSVDTSIPKSLEAICLKAMATELEDRYATAGEMRVDLERFLRGLPPRHADVGAAHAAVLRAKYVVRHPVTAVAAAVGLALIISSIVREDVWIPPDVSAFHFELGMEEPRWLSREVEPRIAVSSDLSLIGIEVNTDDDAWLYVFSLYGDDEDQSGWIVRPERAEIFPTLYESEDKSPLPIRVEPGTHRVTCSSLEQPSKYAGLWVIAWREENPALQELQDELYRRERDELVSVTLAEAEELGLKLLEQTRGAAGGPVPSVAELTKEDRRKLFGPLAAQDEVQEDEWRKAGFKVFRLSYAVDRKDK